MLASRTTRRASGRVLCAGNATTPKKRRLRATTIDGYRRDLRLQPNRTAMPEAVYRRVRELRDDYLAERRVDLS